MTIIVGNFLANSLMTSKWPISINLSISKFDSTSISESNFEITFGENRAANASEGSMFSPP